MAAAQVLEHEPFGLADDSAVPRRHVEIALSVETHVRERMAAQADVALAEDLYLARPRAREKLELRFHCARVRNQTRAAATARTTSR